MSADRGASLVERHGNQTVADLQAYVPGPTAAEISQRYGISPGQLIKLSSNEAPFGPSPRVREALRSIAGGDDIHRYPNSKSPRLRAAIAAQLKVQPEQIVLTAGSSDAWSPIVRAFSSPGETVLAIDPSMLSYGEVAVLSERRVRWLSIEFPFAIEPNTVLEAIDPSVRSVFLSSPNNTTSRLIAPQVIADVAGSVPEVMLVVDEHYIEAADSYREVSAVALVSEFPNIIVTRTFSKMYGLAGLRIGYAVCDVAVAGLVDTFRSKWPVSVVAEGAAVAALEDRAHLQKNIDATTSGRAHLEKALDEIEGVKLVPAPQGGFLLFRTNKPAQEVVEGLFRRGVMVRGDLLGGYIRVSVGTSEQNERFVTSLRGALEE